MENKTLKDIKTYIEERIETICNHGIKRDMRFRKYLLRDLDEIFGELSNGK